MPLSKKLLRLLKKNVSEFDTFEAEAIAEEVKIQGGELKAFLTAIDLAFESNEVKLQQAERSLEISSRELAETNTQLFNTNSTLNSILNGLEEGLIVFDQTGRCDPFASSASEIHFSKKFNEANIYFHEFFKNDISACEDVKNWVTLMFSGRFEWDQIQDLGPKWVPRLDNRKIEMKYRPIMTAYSTVEKILVITKDVTLEFEAQREAQNQKNIADTIIEICKSPRQFQEMLDSVNLLNSKIKILIQDRSKIWNEADDITFKLTLHTIKGTVSGFGFRTIVDNVHKLEADYSALVSVREKLALIIQTTEFLDISSQFIFSNYGFIIEKFMNAQADQSSIASIHKIHDFYDELKLLRNGLLLKSFREKFLLIRFSDLFLTFNAVIKKTSCELGKSINPIQISSDAIFVCADQYSELFISFVHIFTNICDHGIESPEIRKSLNKSEFGSVRIDCRRIDDVIHLKISDDGRGIAVEKLRKKISGTRLDREYSSSENFLNCIFEAQVSTKDEITPWSGYGLGLNAVYLAVLKLKGKVNVKSEVNIGTTFEFQLPVIENIYADKIIESPPKTA